MEKITLLFEGKHIRCFESNGQMWFCGKDACDILGYAAKSHKMALNKIDETNKHPYSVFDPHAAHHEGLVIYISEFGVIELAIKCRFETAKPFREFVKQTIVDLRNKRKFILNVYGRQFIRDLNNGDHFNIVLIRRMHTCRFCYNSTSGVIT